MRKELEDRLVEFSALIHKLNDIAILDQALDESNQLVSIFYRTVQTARKNNSS